MESIDTIQRTGDMLAETTREFVHRTAEFLPQLVMALVVVFIGYLIAKVARFLVERGLRAMNLNVLTERAGTDNFLAQAGFRGDTCTLFGLLAFWLVLVESLVEAFKRLGLTYITDLLHRVVLFTPNLLRGHDRPEPVGGRRRDRPAHLPHHPGRLDACFCACLRARRQGLGRGAAGALVAA
jgi:hypothetical protein